MFGLAFAMSGPAGGAAAPAGGMAAFQQIIPLVFMFAIFYFLLIRPQQKKAKEHKALLESIKKGDSIITAGGVHGKITSVEDGIAGLEIATGVIIKINKAYIASVKKD
jgi:preprotein translocase subunit YajC